MARSVRRGLLVVTLLALTAGIAFAQASGSISGKVTDASGGALPGVKVTVSGPGLQTPLVGTTQLSGAYQLPSVPVGTVTVTFELAGFKKAPHKGVVVTANTNATVDQKMEIDRDLFIGDLATLPIVDVKKVSTGDIYYPAWFDPLGYIPTTRDPWQIVNMAPGVQAGMNIGGAQSGQQVGLAARGTGANIQWNLEGGSITDLSSNTSPDYFNFDSFEEIQVITGGGDASVQSSGLWINLTTKSGSNVFKGTSTFTFANDAMQANNVSSSLFAAASSGFLSGSPLKKIDVWSVEYGGPIPIKRNRLWFWGAYDRQDINAGVVNYFDATKADPLCAQLTTAQKLGTLSSLVTYGQLQAVQNCLFNDRTLIKDIEWKFDVQVSTSNKLRWLFTSDNKYRNARSASANTARESTTQQTSYAPWKLPLPTHAITHTWVASDKLIFNNQFTYVGGGFFLDYQDARQCGGSSQYLGAKDAQTYISAGRTSPMCLWNLGSILNRTTGFTSNSLKTTEATVRRSTELKTDGNYFVPKFLGGDHTLKFGVGYRRNPIQTFAHYSGGSYTTVQCVGNVSTNCAGGYVSPGSASGLVPYSAVIARDYLTNVEWWSYNGYVQDEYSLGRVRLTGGVRYDWQQSKSLGGCDPSNILLPTALPAQCEAPTTLNPQTGKTILPFKNWAPRISGAYDPVGNGKTSIHASGGYYYQTIGLLARSLSGLDNLATVTYGPNLSSGACDPNALLARPTATCWTDANRDGMVQVNELVGQPTSIGLDVHGLAAAVGNTVTPSAQLSRTRELIVGVSQELMPNLGLSVDYTYRKYDRGTATYSVGFTPNDSLTALSSLYIGPYTYTDPTTGKSAPYYIVCSTCARPSGLTQTTITNADYSRYHGVDIVATKRLAHGWQMHVALTLQNAPGHTAFAANPTGLAFTQDISTLARYLFKANGSYQFPWGIVAGANININDGDARVMTINGPGTVPGSGGCSWPIFTTPCTPGTNLTYSTLTFQPANAVRFKSAKLVDVGVQKIFTFHHGRNRLSLMLDAFNVLDVATIQSYASNSLSGTFSASPTSIVPPRVFRIGAKIAF